MGGVGKALHRGIWLHGLRGMGAGALVEKRCGLEAAAGS
jgi:hypothetical protein